MTATTFTVGYSRRALRINFCKIKRNVETRTLDDRNYLVDVVLVVCDAIVSNSKLSVGCLGMTVAVREIVNDDLDELAPSFACCISHVCVETGDLRDGVQPNECGDAGNLSGFRCQSRVCDLCDSSINLGCVVRTEVGLAKKLMSYSCCSKYARHTLQLAKGFPAAGVVVGPVEPEVVVVEPRDVEEDTVEVVRTDDDELEDAAPGLSSSENDKFMR